MAKGGFRGMPGGMNQAAMMKQAQKMQQEMLRMQQEMETKTYTAAAGGGMVKALGGHLLSDGLPQGGEVGFSKCDGLVHSISYSRSFTPFQALR